MTHLRIGRNQVVRKCSSILLHSTALALVSLNIAGPAMANGGAGGGVPSNGVSEGSAGLDNPVGVGGNGGAGQKTTIELGGGGGGGAGAITGGAGGDGQSIGSYSSSSGNGGTGGVHGQVSTDVPVGVSAGTNGGAGGNGNGGRFNDGVGGGGGGAGGYGAVITASNVSGALADNMTGGNGGAGGNGAGRSFSPGTGGTGGTGGIGLFFNDNSQLKTLTVDATIQGGNGGAAGAGGGATGGSGGAGMVGGNLDITLNPGGTIAGGFAGGQVGNETFRANAITFSGGSNSLTLGVSSNLLGNIAIDGGSLRFNGTNIIVANKITGVGSLIKDSPGTLTLSGNNTFTGTTMITSGVVQVGNGGTTGALSGNIVNNGALAFDRSDALTFGGVIAGTGTLTKRGAGTLILTGTSIYTGATTVDGGTLLVNGSLGSTGITVSSDATLGGSGSVAGAVIIQSGGTLSAGNSPGTLSLAALTLNAGSTSRFELNSPGVVGGTGAGGNDLVRVTGNLTLGGTMNVQASAAGYYRLFNYGGELAGNFATVVTSGSTFVVNLARVDTAISGQVNLAILGVGQNMQFWDGADSIGNGAVDGGTGTWNSAATNWTGRPAQAEINGQWDQSVGVFAGAAGGTVTVQGTQAFDTLQFSTNAYVLSGGTLGFAPATGSAATIQVDSGISATIASALSDGSTGTGLIKAGAGALTLTGTNSYTGNTTVQGGTLIGNVAAIRGNIANAGTVVFDQASAGSFGGTIEGSAGVNGAMIKRGAGALTLAGTSSLGWSIEQGSLITSTQKFTGDAAIATGATLVFDQLATGSYTGRLSGGGTVAINGGHRFELTGDSSAFTGLLDVGNGMLISNGAIGGTMQIGAGGFVGGSGTLGSLTVGGGGTVSPGNSIGTLTITGDLTFEAGSTFVVEADPTSNTSDHITVSGRAILNGGAVTHIGMDGTYKRDTTYTILTAAGGVSGEFAGASSDYAFLDALLGYSQNAVTLTLRRNDIDFATIGQNRNQRATAQAVQAMPSGSPLFEAIVMLGTDQARTAFDSLSGEMHASLQSVLVEDSRFIRSAALDRMRLGSAAGDSERGVTWWMQGIGNWGHLEANDNAHRITHNASGVLMGVDAMAAEQVQFGLFGGWQTGNAGIRALGTDADFDSYHAGLYAGAGAGRFSIRTGVALSLHDADITRRISFTGLNETAQTRRSASTVQGFAEIGYRLDLMGTVIEPFANFAHVSLDSEATSERGDAAALRLANMSMGTSFSTLGARIEQSFKLGGLRADLRSAAGWRRAFGDLTPEAQMAFASGVSFSIGGTPIARDALSADVGLALSLSKRARLDIGYTGDVAKSAENHSARATFSLAF